MHELKEEIKGMRRGRHENPSRISSHEDIPITSYAISEHSTTQSNLKRCNLPNFLLRESGKGGMTEEEVSLLLFQTLEGIKEDLKEMEGEECRFFLEGFEIGHSYSHDGCEHSAT